MSGSSTIGSDISVSNVMAYKDMEQVLKEVTTDVNSSLEKVCMVKLKYAEEVAKSQVLIDPEISSILHFPTPSGNIYDQEGEQDVDKTYQKMMMEFQEMKKE